MHLNPVLFPAPRCRYAPELLIGELIWIPKYKTNLTTQTLSSHRATQSVGAGEAFRNSQVLFDENFFSKLGGNFNVPRIAKCNLKQKDDVAHHSHSKSAFSPQNDFDLQFSNKILNPTTAFDYNNASVYKASIFEGKDDRDKKENTASFLNYFPLLNEDRDDTLVRNMLKLEDKSFFNQSPLKESNLHSEDVSMDVLDSPIRAGPTFLEKKFARNQFSNKVSKASTAIRDDYSNLDSNISSANHSKKPSIKNWQGHELKIVDEDNEGNFDFGIGEEFPVEDEHVFISPKTISNYQTRTNEKNYLSRRLMTEYSFQAQGETQTIKKADLASICRETKPQPRTDITGHIPCLILKSGVPSSKVLIYFHGNGEDIYLSYDLLTHIRNNLNVHVLAIEYPGYGLYKGEPNEQRILADAEAVFDYLTIELNIDPKNIILFGRSIGTGPATYLASKREVGALALMSAFTSIRGVVRDLAGKFAQYFIKERFNNLENIAKVKCPVFLVHGLRDSLIPHKHSQDLYNACNSMSELVLPKDMNHVEFDFYEDFTEPLADFLNRANFNLESPNESPIDFPIHLFGIPNKTPR